MNKREKETRNSVERGKKIKISKCLNIEERGEKIEGDFEMVLILER